MFFKKEEAKNNNFLKKVCALLIHAAKIDENYTDKEEEIIKKTLNELGIENENISKTIEEAKIIEERSQGSQFIMVSLKDSVVQKAKLIYGVYPKNGVSNVVTYKDKRLPSMTT